VQRRDTGPGERPHYLGLDLRSKSSRGYVPDGEPRHWSDVGFGWPIGVEQGNSNCSELPKRACVTASRGTDVDRRDRFRASETIGSAKLSWRAAASG